MLIDFHTHVFPEKIAANALGVLAKNSGITPCTLGTPADTLRLFVEANVDFGAALSIATNERQTQSVNNFAIGLLGEKKLLPFGSVYPFSDGALDEIDRLYAAGIRGIKLHPEYQGFFVGDDRCYRVVERATSKNMAVVFHAGKDVAYPDTYNAPPRELRRLADAFAGGKLIFAHLGGFGVGEEVLEFLAGADCYLDTACMAQAFSKEQAKEIISLHGTDKVLFGSDCPWEHPGVTYSFLKSLGLSAKQEAQITHENALALLRDIGGIGDESI